MLKPSDWDPFIFRFLTFFIFSRKQQQIKLTVKLKGIRDRVKTSLLTEDFSNKFSNRNFSNLLQSYVDNSFKNKLRLTDCVWEANVVFVYEEFVSSATSIDLVWIVFALFSKRAKFKTQIIKPVNFIHKLRRRELNDSFYVINNAN